MVRILKFSPGVALAACFIVGLTGTVAGTENSELIENLYRMQHAREGNPQLASAEVPVVGCPQDGQIGLVSAPKTPATTRALLPPGAAPALAFYTTTAAASRGIFAPRGWSCRGSAGSDGDTLYVVPPGARGNPGDEGYDGLLVRRRFADGGTSGRFEVARVAGRLFPGARALADQVRAEGADDPGLYVSFPWPADRLLRLSDHVIAYTTPGGVQGLGQPGRPPYGPDPTSGLVVYETSSEGDPYLLQLDVRLPRDRAHLQLAIAAAFLERLNLSATAPTAPATETNSEANGKALAVVRAFYEALGQANGEAASRLVIPERRQGGPYAPGAITRFYASLAEPLRLTAIRALSEAEVEVGYRYRIRSGGPCVGRAVVTTRPAGDMVLIARIRPSNGC